MFSSVGLMGNPRKYATWDASAKGSGITLSGGSLIASTNSTTLQCVRSSAGKTSGLWYWEITVGAYTNYLPYIGLAAAAYAITAQNYLGQDTTANSAAYYGGDGKIIYVNNSGSTYGATYTTGDVLGFTLNASARTVAIRKNDALQVTTTALVGTDAIYAGFSGVGIGSQATTANFGASAFTYPSRPGTDGANPGLY